MTRNNGTEVVRLGHRDWIGICAAVITIMTTVLVATIALESRLSEVITRQEQLELRINRIEDQIDRGALK